ncbi:CBD9-like protein [Eremomyces bilateralis CBS 781.70]|uniref:CBD9-like protein n=1 Tax=Eremomyces bilateralis CBS 781.70 TaxID=1392243 RepID=A0A6G1FUA4_9PEZI|nr:CBD9-like protein [Eremomyces bilateralis CBS 781.70]KAF1809343.1 CBD9-like protein [Eremomyces bilateralis CBS 781.70]
MAIAHSLRLYFVAVLLLLVSWAAGTSPSTDLDQELVARQNNSTSAGNPSSTFYYSQAHDDGYIAFTVAAIQESGDLYFRLSAPAVYSWFAIGTGSRMKGSLMFIIYSSANKTGITVSPRRAYGNSEPIYDSSIQLDIIHPDPGQAHANGISGDQYFLTAHCKSCLRVPDPWIDLTKKDQSWIFALGVPGSRYAMNTDDKSAPLRRHDSFGSFTMDMVAASTQSDDDVDIPPLGTAPQGAQMVGSLHEDFNQASWAHGSIMCVAFLIVFPMGIIAVRIMERVKLHMWLQGFGLFLSLCGMSVGIYLTPLFNRSKHFSAHQIIGVIVMAFLFTQFAIGFLHHRKFMRTEQTTPLIKIHKLALGPVTLLLGLANAGLGFAFAQNSFYLIPYIVILVLVALVFAATTGWKFFRGKRGPKGARPGPYPSGPQPPPYETGNGEGHGRPPQEQGIYGGSGAGLAAGASPYGGGYTSFNATRSDIQLGNMPSHASVREEDMQPTQPRPMV